MTSLWPDMMLLCVIISRWLKIGLEECSCLHQVQGHVMWRTTSSYCESHKVSSDQTLGRLRMDITHEAVRWISDKYSCSSHSDLHRLLQIRYSCSIDPAYTWNHCIHHVKNWNDNTAWKAETLLDTLAFAKPRRTSYVFCAASTQFDIYVHWYDVGPIRPSKLH